MQWLASNTVVVIVGASTLCVFFSCMQMSGSARLTQISSVSFFLSDAVCVAIVVVHVSVWAARVVFKMISFCLVVMIVFPVVVVFSNIIFGKFDFVRVSSFFFADSSSLASWTGVVKAMWDSVFAFLETTWYLFVVVCLLIGHLQWWTELSGFSRLLIQSWTDVVVSPNIIFEKFDFVRVSSFFLIRRFC